MSTNSFCIINLGGKQHKVFENSVCTVNLLNVEPTKQFNVPDVLLACKEGTIVAPNNAECIVEVVRHFKGKKITTIKFRRRKNSMCKRGSRAQLTQVKIIKLFK